MGRAQVPKHERGEVERLEKLVNKFERGQLPHIDWLDRIALKSIEKIKEQESKRSGKTSLHLIVDLRTFEHPVAFEVRLTVIRKLQELVLPSLPFFWSTNSFSSFMLIQNAESSVRY
jgi:hypothetical protein